MTIEEKEEIRKIMAEALSARCDTCNFTMTKEQHYVDHIWIKELREWQANIKSSAVRTVVKLFITGLIGLMILGFIFWGSSKF